MKKIAKSLIAVGLIAAFTALPLIACGDDGKDGGEGSGALYGERVTEQQWKDGIDATLNAQSYSESVITTKDGAECKWQTSLFDFTDGVVYYDIRTDADSGLGIENGTIYNVRLTEQYVAYYDYADGEYTLQGLEINETRTGLTGRGFDGIVDFLTGYSFPNNDGKLNKAKDSYATFTYDAADGAYKYIAESAKDGKNELRFWFKDGYVCKARMSLLSGSPRYAKEVVCTDFGKTTVTVPAELKQKIDEIKSGLEQLGGIA